MDAPGRKEEQEPHSGRLPSLEGPRMLFKSEEGLLGLFVIIGATLLLAFGSIDGAAWATVCATATGAFSVGRGVRKHGKP